MFRSAQLTCPGRTAARSAAVQNRDRSKPCPRAGGDRSTFRVWNSPGSQARLRASATRCWPGQAWNGPGSAVHHCAQARYVLHRARDTKFHSVGICASAGWHREFGARWAKPAPQSSRHSTSSRGHCVAPNRAPLTCAVLTKPLSMTKPGYGKSLSGASALRPPTGGRGPSGTVTHAMPGGAERRTNPSANRH
jgi:hypothetical protein